MNKINKLTILIFTILLTTLSSCNKSSSDNFTINGNIKGIENGRKVSLKIQKDRKIVTIDSILVKDGKFDFKGNITEPTQFGIFIDKIQYGIFPIVGMNDHLKIEMNKDSIQNTKFTGSKLQDELTAMYKDKEEFSKKTQPLFSEYQIAQKAKDTVKMKEINDKFKAMQHVMSLKDWNYVKEHKDSYLTPIVLSQLIRDPSFKDSCKVAFNNLTDRVKNSNIASSLKDYYKKEEEKLNAAKKAVEKLNTGKKPVKDVNKK